MQAVGRNEWLELVQKQVLRLLLCSLHAGSAGFSGAAVFPRPSVIRETVRATAMGQVVRGNGMGTVALGVAALVVAGCWLLSRARDACSVRAESCRLGPI